MGFVLSTQIISHRLNATDPDPVDGMFNLSERLGAPNALATLGMPSSGIETVTDRVTREPYWNPRPIEHEPLRQLIVNAYYGKR